MSKYPYWCGNCYNPTTLYLTMEEITKHWRTHMAAILLQYAVI